VHGRSNGFFSAYGHSVVRHDLLHDAAAQQRESALCHRFTHRARDGCGYRGLSFWITGGHGLGILQDTEQQFPLSGAQNAFILH
jgi:hypothetical protein